MISKQLKKILLVSSSVLMCLGLAGGVSANADSGNNMNSKYRLYKYMYHTPTSFSGFEKVYNAYHQMNPQQKKTERNKLIQQSNAYDHMKSAKKKAYARKQAKHEIYLMNHSHGLYNYYKNICGVLDSIYVTDGEAKDAFNRYQKVYPKIMHMKTLYKRARRVNKVMRRIGVKRMMKQYRDETFKAINYDREIRHLPPVHYSPTMNKVAAMRAKQLTHNYSHYDNHGKLYMEDDLNQLGIKDWSAGENIDAKGAPLVNLETNGSIYMPDTGGQMGDESEDQMMYHDSFKDRRPGTGTFLHGQGAEEDGGHRSNILNAKDVSVGIGIGYNKKTHEFYVAEDFHVGNKNRSKYKGKVHYHNYLKDKNFRNF